MRFIVYSETDKHQVVYYAGSRTPGNVTDVDWVQDSGDATLFRTIGEAAKVGDWLEESGLADYVVAEELNNG